MKPKDQTGYQAVRTEDCISLLATVYRKSGPWKQELFLVGGMVPSLRFPDGGHIGTTDIDIVLNTDGFEDLEAYKTLEKNLKTIGLERGKNQDGKVQNFRWTLLGEDGQEKASLDLLCPSEDSQGGKVIALKEVGEKKLAAFGIPGARLVFDDYEEIEIRAELLDGGGVTKVKIKVVGHVAYIVLKALAFKDRCEGKDVYDLLFTLREFEGGPEALGKLFKEKMEANPGEPLYQETLEILKESFLDDDEVSGVDKEGPAHYANFVVPVDDEERSVARQDAVALVEMFVQAIGA